MADEEEGGVMGIKQEVEAAAIAAIKCPSCKAEPTQSCHYVWNGGGVARTEKVKPHQRRLSAFMSSSNVKWSSQQVKQDGR